MTTLASPTLGGATQSLWLVAMQPGASGPVHAFADEVIWAVTRGSLELHSAGSITTLDAGDTAVLPGGVLRQFIAGPEGFEAVATAPAHTVVTREDGTSVGTPDWVV